MTWEEQMAAKAKARRNARIEAEFGYLKVEEPWRFDINHPANDKHCRDCCEFTLYNPDAPWLGSGWRQTCFPNEPDSWCRFDHDHHEGEVWMAPIPLIGVPV